MKTKGTSVWEQYIECVVLAFAIAVMGWFAWGAFGSKIKHQQGRHTLEAATVDEALMEAADSLDGKLKDYSPSPLSIPVPDPIFNEFSRQSSLDVSPKNRVVFPTIDMTASIDSNQDVQTELREYVSPVVPSPQGIKARQWFGTIEESVVDATEELDYIVGPPFDTQWIQIAGSVDIGAILESYSATDDLASIPTRWYREAIDIFDIEIERQRKTEDGWADIEMIAPLQNQASYRDRINEKSIDAIELDEIIGELRTGKQDSIVKPDFYSLKGYTPSDIRDPAQWDGEEVETEKTPLQVLVADLEEIEEDIEKQKVKIEKINEDIKEAGSGGGGSGGGGGGGSDNKKVERLKTKLVKEQAKLDQMIATKEGIETEIEELKLASGEIVETVMEGKVWIWGHDSTVVPGETYRYRMRIQLANPFFGHKPSLYSHQHDLAEKVVLASQNGEWTEPIKVQERKQWFVKRAKAANVLRGDNVIDKSYVSIDVFEFSDGEWARKTSEVHVGQPIAIEATGEHLDWFVLDVAEDMQGVVTLLQNIKTEQMIAKRSGEDVESARYRDLLKRIKDQSSVEVEEESDEDSGTPPGGGDGMGGGMGGGGGGIGGGRQ
jgi:uncharacterized membrane protein YgcG